MCGAGELEAASLPEDGDPAAVACSICLDAVTGLPRDRSTAKLQCGHEFHLDCIGSAFNAKGMMQCPNCRKVEKGSWLYATGVRPMPELSMDGWPYDDLYDLSYAEMIFGINWCPFDRLSHISSSFEEGEVPPSIAYQHIFGNFLFTEQPPYLGLLQPSAPSTSRVLPENPLNSASYHHHHQHRRRHWGHVPPPAGVPRHGGPNSDTQFRPWGHHSFRPGLVDGPRPNPNPNPDGLTPRTIIFGPPAADVSAATAGGVFVSSADPRLVGGSRGFSSGGHDGFQHRAPPGGRRSAMVLPIGPPPPPPPPQSDEAGFYVIFPPAPGSIVGPREAFSASAVGGRSGSRHQYGGIQRQHHHQDHATDDAAHPQQPYYHHFM